MRSDAGVASAFAVLLALAAPACGDESNDALRPCDLTPAATGTAAHPPPETRWPDGAVVDALTSDGPITHVRGRIAETPTQVRKRFETQRGLRVLHREDDGKDMELLLSDGTHRLAVEAIEAPAGAGCIRSTLFIRVAAEPGAKG